MLLFPPLLPQKLRRRRSMYRDRLCTWQRQGCFVSEKYGFWDCINPGVLADTVPGPQFPRTYNKSTCWPRPPAPFFFVTFPHIRPSSSSRILLPMSLTLSPHLARDLALRLVYFCSAPACGSHTVPFPSLPLPPSQRTPQVPGQTALRIFSRISH